jgi:hypothetical protein
MNALVPKPASRTVAATSGSVVVPAVIADAGDHAAKRFLEFFAATPPFWKIRVGLRSADKRP